MGFIVSNENSWKEFFVTATTVFKWLLFFNAKSQILDLWVTDAIGWQIGKEKLRLLTTLGCFLILEWSNTQKLQLL